jgi:hypothetical protein
MIYLVQCDNNHVATHDDRRPKHQSLPPFRCGSCGSVAVRVWSLTYDSLSAVVRARIADRERAETAKGAS